MKEEKFIMKKMLVALGILTTMLISTQNSFAACPCENPCPAPCAVANPCPCPVATPCPCPLAAPCPCVSPACPIATPCCPDTCCDSCCDPCGCKEKCRWWKFWQNKNCCEKCNKCDRCCD